MATITSHTLNGSDGTHAGGIPVTLTNLTTRTLLFRAVMDDGGRLSQSVAPSLVEPSATYELVFDLAAYWAARGSPASVAQIVLRFTMRDPEGAYHMPVIFNPNSYSMWCSS
ncbi:hydroxyisourate hydrolase [uncultured Hoeflea sp.]|uniref:hydroxyisourate hydrolase n=1 Tax=uncultured Hoeflea sp. TaxID=538666 RepID=UPI002635F4DE|nr:hydroxyisourate hydrolase [uncultured Hoeflea sp.]